MSIPTTSQAKPPFAYTEQLHHNLLNSIRKQSLCYSGGFCKTPRGFVYQPLRWTLPFSISGLFFNNPIQPYDDRNMAFPNPAAYGLMYNGYEDSAYMQYQRKFSKTVKTLEKTSNYLTVNPHHELYKRSLIKYTERLRLWKLERNLKTARKLIMSARKTAIDDGRSPQTMLTDTLRRLFFGSYREKNVYRDIPITVAEIGSQTGLNKISFELGTKNLEYLMTAIQNSVKKLGKKHGFEGAASFYKGTSFILAGVPHDHIEKVLAEAAKNAGKALRLSYSGDVNALPESLSRGKGEYYNPQFSVGTSIISSVKINTIIKEDRARALEVTVEGVLRIAEAAGKAIRAENIRGTDERHKSTTVVRFTGEITFGEYSFVPVMVAQKKGLNGVKKSNGGIKVAALPANACNEVFPNEPTARLLIRERINNGELEAPAKMVGKSVPAIDEAIKKIKKIKTAYIRYLTFGGKRRLLALKESIKGLKEFTSRTGISNLSSLITALHAGKNYSEEQIQFPGWSRKAPFEKDVTSSYEEIFNNVKFFEQVSSWFKKTNNKIQPKAFFVFFEANGFKPYAKGHVTVNDEGMRHLTDTIQDTTKIKLDALRALGSDIKISYNKAGDEFIIAIMDKNGKATSAQMMEIVTAVQEAVFRRFENQKFEAQVKISIDRESNTRRCYIYETETGKRIFTPTELKKTEFTEHPDFKGENGNESKRKLFPSGLRVFYPKGGDMADESRWVFGLENPGNNTWKRKTTSLSLSGGTMELKFQRGTRITPHTIERVRTAGFKHIDALKADLFSAKVSRSFSVKFEIKPNFEYMTRNPLIRTTVRYGSTIFLVPFLQRISGSLVYWDSKRLAGDPIEEIPHVTSILMGNRFGQILYGYISGLRQPGLPINYGGIVGSSTMNIFGLLISQLYHGHIDLPRLGIDSLYVGLSNSAAIKLLSKSSVFTRWIRSGTPLNLAVAMIAENFLSSVFRDIMFRLEEIAISQLHKMNLKGRMEEGSSTLKRMAQGKIVDYGRMYELVIKIKSHIKNLPLTMTSSRSYLESLKEIMRLRQELRREIDRIVQTLSANGPQKVAESLRAIILYRTYLKSEPHLKARMHVENIYASDEKRIKGFFRQMRIYVARNEDLRRRGKLFATLDPGQIISRDRGYVEKILGRSIDSSKIMSSQDPQYRDSLEKEVIAKLRMKRDGEIKRILAEHKKKIGSDGAKMDAKQKKLEEQAKQALAQILFARIHAFRTLSHAGQTTEIVERLFFN